MAFDFWATIELDGVTLYVTTSGDDNYRDISAVETHFQEYLKLGELVQSFQSRAISRELPATLTVKLVNEDGWLDPYLGFGASAEIWDNRKVTIKTGGSRGSDWATMTTRFEGLIRRGTLRHTRSEVAFTLYDIRIEDDQPILTTTFNATTYPNAEDRALGNYVPVIFGDFYTGESAGVVPAYCIDTTTNEYKFASHAVHSSDFVVYVNGSPTSPSATDLLNAEFTLSGAYDADDIVTVRTKGIQGTRPVTGGGATFEFAADIIHHLLTAYGGASTGEIDLASFIAANTDSDKHANRRWFGGDTQVSVMSAIGDIVFENNFLFYVQAGLYTLNFWVPSGVSTATITEDDFKIDSLTTQYDPQDVYVNRLTALYNRNRVKITDRDTQWRGTVSVDSPDEQTAYGLTIERETEFNWLYDASDVTLQLQRLLFVWASRSHTVELTLIDETPDASATLWNTALASTYLLNFWQYDNAPLVVRKIRRNFADGNVMVSALAVADAYPLARWSNTAADPQTITPGYWGPTTVPSKQTKWF